MNSSEQYLDQCPQPHSVHVCADLTNIFSWMSTKLTNNIRWNPVNYQHNCMALLSGWIIGCFDTIMTG